MIAVLSCVEVVHFQTPQNPWLDYFVLLLALFFCGHSCVHESSQEFGWTLLRTFGEEASYQPTFGALIACREISNKLPLYICSIQASKQGYGYRVSSWGSIFSDLVLIRIIRNLTHKKVESSVCLHNFSLPDKWSVFEWLMISSHGLSQDTWQLCWTPHSPSAWETREWEAIDFTWCWLKPSKTFTGDQDGRCCSSYIG